MDLLFIIPARGGSKRIPGKNTKLLGNKPLIYYSIEFARKFTKDDNICLTTDSSEIIDCAAQIGLICPFIRPPYLAADTSGSYEVLQHALSFYKNQNRYFDVIVLLQPTSPFRKSFHLTEALNFFDPTMDMLVSVQKSKANPYYNLFEEDSSGNLMPSKGKGEYNLSQEAPPVYQYNGSLYIINVKSLETKKSFADFSEVRKYVMEDKYSIDLDTTDDWKFAEFLIATGFNKQ